MRRDHVCPSDQCVCQAAGSPIGGRTSAEALARTLVERRLGPAGPERLQACEQIRAIIAADVASQYADMLDMEWPADGARLALYTWWTDLVASVVLYGFDVVNARRAP